MQKVGRYEVLEELARGGMGVVCKARDPAAQRLVALKLLLGGGFAREVSRKRFRREAEALVKVSHPNVVRLYDFAETAAGVPYMVMELVEGDSLQRLLQLRGPLDVDDAVDAVTTLCAAVAACHRAGVLHRDLKPDNVLVARDGTLKLTDFGLVRDTDASLSRTQLSRTGELMGTPGYWAPEQARGQLDAIGPATDVYGLGGVLFALLTGRPPYEGDDLYGLLDAMQAPVRAPSSLEPAVPRWLDRVVARALAADPAQRFATPSELAEALAAAEEPRGSRGWTTLAALVVAIGGVAMGAAIMARQGRSPPASASPPPASASPPPASASPPPATPTPPAASPAPRVDDALPSPAARAYYERGQARLDTGDVQGALDDAHAAIRLQPDYGEAYHCLGVAYLELEDYERGLASFDEAVRLLPGAAPALHNRGALKSAMNDNVGALADYTAALELNPGLVQSWSSRGLLRIEEGDLEGALADLRRAVAGRPESFQEVLWCAVLSGDAEPLARFADGGDWEPELARYVLGRVTAEALTQRARDAADEEEISQQLSEAHCQIGFSLEFGGDPAAAREHYEACVATGVTGSTDFGCAQARLRQLD